MSFWDTSALAKYYTPEPDRAGYIALAKSLAPIHVGRLADYELQTTLRRKESEGVIAAGAADAYPEQFRDDIVKGVMKLHEESGEVREKFAGVLDDCFSPIPPVFVRTADALHIATAQQAGEKDFVTADIRQKKAAEACGLAVHP